MNGPERTEALLPLRLPEEAELRLILVILRRMAAHGLQDSRAVMLALHTWRTPFRQPLTLLRAYLVEVARASHRRIRFAPCCAQGMTLDEGRLIGILATAGRNPTSAVRHLGLLCESEAVSAPLSVARLFGEALDELGRPLRLHSA